MIFHEVEKIKRESFKHNLVTRTNPIIDMIDTALSEIPTENIGNVIVSVDNVLENNGHRRQFIESIIELAYN